MARIGFLGHTYPGMLDMYSDFTQVHAQTGAHVEVLEIDELVDRVETADAGAIEGKGDEIRQTFDLVEAGADPIAAEITPEIFDWSARVAVGLDRLVDDFELDGLTYYYRGIGGNIAERVAAGLIVGNSLLTARGVPAAGEGDLKTCLAMLLLDRLGAGGSYTEFYALDFDEGFVLMGHDGPGHLAIADGRPVARALKLFHGKAGAGLSIEMQVRLGPVTIVCLTQTADGRLKLIAAEGESIAGPAFKIGNTNTRIRFARARPSSSTAGVPRARRTTSRSVSGTSSRASKRSPTCSGSSSPLFGRRLLDRLELLERLAAALAPADRAARRRAEDVLEPRLGRAAVRAAERLRLQLHERRRARRARRRRREARDAQLLAARRR